METFKNEPITLETTDHCYGCIHELHCKVKIGETCPGSERIVPSDEWNGVGMDGGDFDV